MMGQQQHTMELVAVLRRIMLVALVAALMALTMAVMSAPPLAANGNFSEGAKNAVVKSNDNARDGLNTAAFNHFKNN